MEIKVRHTSSFVSVQVVESLTTIDLGMLNGAERDELACILVDAAFEMGPKHYNDCAEWFSAILAKRGIELPNAQNQGLETAKGGEHD
jgi:hypothetical protein